MDQIKNDTFQNSSAEKNPEIKKKQNILKQPRSIWVTWKTFTDESLILILRMKKIKENPHIIKNWSEFLKKRNRSFSAFIATGSLTSLFILDNLCKIQKL